MKNIQRQSQNYKTTAPLSPSHTQAQYFPIPITLHRKQIRPFIEQSPIVKQTPQQYEKLARMYQKQNEEIQTKNNELLDVVRKLKNKQSDLLLQISSLQNYYRKLLTNFQRIQNNKQNQILNLQINNKQNLQYQSQQKKAVNSYEQYKKKSIITPPNPIKHKQVRQQQEQTESLESERQNFIKSLNDQFCKLVQESINEKDSIKRKKLRKQLAELASQMKRIRNTEDYKAISKQPGNQYELVYKKQINFQSSNDNSLDPYLDIKNTGCTQIKQFNKNRFAHYSSCNELQKLKSNTVVANCQNLFSQ